MPTLATHTGKFYGKLCRRPWADCAICRKILSKAVEPSAACGGYSEAEQGRRSQSASAAPRHAARCGNRNPQDGAGVFGLIRLVDVFAAVQAGGHIAAVVDAGAIL